MMNLEKIAQRIKSPNMCESFDIDSFKELAEKYPYTQIFSILYLKSLSQNNDIRFDEELQKHAYRVNDRNRLFELIEGKNEFSVEVENQKLTEANEIALISSEIEIKKPEIQIDEPIIVPITSPLEILSNIDDDDYEEEMEFIGEKEIIEVEIELEKESVLEDITPLVFEIEPIEKSFEIEDLSNDSENEEIVSIEEINESILDEYIFTEEEQTLNVSEIIPVEEHEISTIESENKNISQDLVEFENEIISSAISGVYELNISESINELENDEVQISNEISTEIESSSVENAIEKEPQIGKKSFSSWLKSSSKELINEVEHSETIDSKDKIDTIVENFIKEEPKISRLPKEEKTIQKEKVEFFSPIKKAKSSLDENLMPVSETLAKIFAAQGNFPKAIFAYEQLILINPEKKTFFVNQIEKLKEKLNT